MALQPISHAVCTLFTHPDINQIRLTERISNRQLIVVNEVQTSNALVVFCVPDIQDSPFVEMYFVYVHLILLLLMADLEV